MIIFAYHEHWMYFTWNIIFIYVIFFFHFLCDIK
jgi:hypothetical protein